MPVTCIPRRAPQDPVPARLPDARQILAALSQYGSPALFVVTAVASVGVPLPVSLLLIVAGSLVAQGAMPVGWAIAMASAGAITGDQIGYAIGRFGGTALDYEIRRSARRTR